MSVHWILAWMLGAQPSVNFDLAPYQAIPDDSEQFMELPVSMTVDGQGRLLVLDIFARKVFAWDLDSRAYLGSYGRSGKGPGEFRFEARSRRQGLILAWAGRIYVLETIFRRLHIFEEASFRFLETREFKPTKGYIRSWGVTRDGALAIKAQSYYNGPSYSAVILMTQGFDSPPDAIREIAPWRVDGKFTQQRDKSGRARYELFPFSPDLVMHANPTMDWFLVGLSDKPEFKRYGADGAVVGRVAMSLKPTPVTDADREEYKHIYFLKQANAKATYPEVKGFFSFALPIGNAGFLVGRVSPVLGKVRAHVVDSQGTVIRPVAGTCGENGQLLGANGRIFALQTDDMGEYTIAELLTGP